MCTHLCLCAVARLCLQVLGSHASLCLVIYQCTVGSPSSLMLKDVVSLQPQKPYFFLLGIHLFHGLWIILKYIMYRPQKWKLWGIYLRHFSILEITNINRHMQWNHKIFSKQNNSSRNSDMYFLPCWAMVKHWLNGWQCLPSGLFLESTVISQRLLNEFM